MVRVPQWQSCDVAPRIEAFGRRRSTPLKEKRE